MGARPPTSDKNLLNIKLDIGLALHDNNSGHCPRLQHTLTGTDNERYTEDVGFLREVPGIPRLIRLVKSKEATR